MRTKEINTGIPALNLMAGVIREFKHDLEGHGYVGDDLPPQTYPEQTKRERASIRRVELQREARQFVASGEARVWLDTLGLPTEQILKGLSYG